MKKVFMIAVMICIYICTAIPVAATTAPLSLTSEAALLMDAETGQVLYAKNGDKRMYPASITKIVTAMVALQKNKPEEIITMSEQAVHLIPRYSSHIALDVGEQLTLDDALYAIMLPSANDASNGIAEHVGGTLEGFAKLMNEAAKAAGAVGSNFTNAHGLPEENHYTTAYDMAMITRQAIKNPQFLTYFGAVLHTIPPTNKQKKERSFPNQHDMLKNTKYKYEGVIGGKVGWTEDAQNTMVTVAKRGTRTLIAVVMKTSVNTNKYVDTKALLDYGFERFKAVTPPTDLVAEQSVSFYDAKGDKLLSRVKIKLAQALPTLYIPVSVSDDDLEVSFNFNEKMVGVDVNAFQPVVSVLIKGRNEPITTLPMTMSGPGFTPTSSSSAEKKPIVPIEGGNFKSIFSTLMIALGVLISLLFSFRQINLQKARNKQMQELRMKRRRLIQQNRQTVYGEVPFSGISNQTYSQYGKDYRPTSNVDPRKLPGGTPARKGKAPVKAGAGSGKSSNRTTTIR